MSYLYGTEIRYVLLLHIRIAVCVEEEAAPRGLEPLRKNLYVTVEIKKHV